MRKKVCTLDAAPAMWAKGCIAIEPKLAPRKPSSARLVAISGMNQKMLAVAVDRGPDLHALTTMKISTPLWLTRRAPKRMTMRELTMLDTAIIAAVPPNTTGNHFARPEMLADQLLRAVHVAEHRADQQRRCRSRSRSMRG